MKFFKVQAKCGHVGRNNYILKLFYVKANNKKEAASIIRQMSRVKHHHKDAIRDVTEITMDEYVRGLKITENDKYFHVSNSSEQRNEHAVSIEEVIREAKVVVYKRKRQGAFLRCHELEKEWSKLKGELAYE